MNYDIIYLTELADLTEGLYWARRKPTTGNNTYGPWMMIGLIGRNPFLTFYVVLIYDKERREWKPSANYSADGSRANNPLDPDEWEFGPRIDAPQQGQRVEYAPRDGSVTP